MTEHPAVSVAQMAAMSDDELNAYREVVRDLAMGYDPVGQWGSRRALIDAMLDDRKAERRAS